MIIVKINGGLGNQMFQYAFGRAMAIMLQTELKLDCNWFDTIEEGDTVRHYELDCFGLKTLFATNDEIERIKGKEFQLPNIIKRIIKKLELFQKESYFVEKFYHCDSSIEFCKDNTYFEGYWQSYLYFDTITDIIKKDFLSNHKMQSNDIILSNQIRDTNSISLHIRRGDYVSNSNATSYHGVSSLDYYYEAIQYIKEKVVNPVVYLFSDDINWVKENLKIDLPIVFVENRDPKRPFDDIYLMHLCKHNIIANSSFSWWGAYLNENSEKIVIAPKKWFNDPSINTEDLIPRNWIRM